MSARTALTFAAVALLLSTAQAGDSHRSATSSAPTLPLVQQECSACHVAYPAGLLPPASWQRLMDHLPRHFGSDASLDATTTASISQWLQAQSAHGAASHRRAAVSPPEDRITRSPWFLREHREIPATVWSRRSVQSPAQCAACHPRADQGAFDEHDVRIPR